MTNTKFPPRLLIPRDYNNKGFGFIEGSGVPLSLMDSPEWYISAIEHESALQEKNKLIEGLRGKLEMAKDAIRKLLESKFVQTVPYAGYSEAIFNGHKALSALESAAVEKGGVND